MSMNSSEQKIFDEIMVATTWQDYLITQLNQKWEEFKKDIETKTNALHKKDDHTSQESTPTIQYGKGGTKDRGVVDFPQETYDAALALKNGLNGLTFVKKGTQAFKYKVNNITNVYEYLSIAVVPENDNRVEKNFVLKSVQVMYREDIKKYILIVLYDSELKNENNVQLMKIVNTANDIVNSVLEGTDGVISFIINGYRAMDEYSSRLEENVEIVNGVNINAFSGGGDTVTAGLYYGGYWSNGRLFKPSTVSGYTWTDRDDFWVRERKNIVVYDKTANQSKTDFKALTIFPSTATDKEIFFGPYEIIETKNKIVVKKEEISDEGENAGAEDNGDESTPGSGEGETNPDSTPESDTDNSEQTE